MEKLRSELGLLSRIAHEIGVYAQAVHQWQAVPLERVVDVERVTGIPREKLRPDFHLPRAEIAPEGFAWKLISLSGRSRKANGKAKRKQQRKGKRRAGIHPKRRAVRHQENRSAQR
jgi:DNA-binding transcriptional regulator YdaS (Cro superfamily)